MVKKILLASALLGGGVAADAAPNGFFNQASNPERSESAIWGATRMTAEALDGLWRYVAKSMEQAVMDSVEESKTHETLKTPGEYDERARHAEEMAKRLAGFVNFDGAGNE